LNILPPDVILFRKRDRIQNELFGLFAKGILFRAIDLLLTLTLSNILPPDVILFRKRDRIQNELFRLFANTASSHTLDLLLTLYLLNILSPDVIVFIKKYRHKINVKSYTYIAHYTSYPD
jgi:hypothetical protein